MNSNNSISHCSLVRGGVVDEKQSNSETFWQVCQNTWSLLSTFDFKALIEEKFSQISTNHPFHSFEIFPRNGNSNQLTKDPVCMKAILKHPRNDSSGWFELTVDNSAIYKMFSVLFPNIKADIDDNLLTCHKEHINKYRRLLVDIFQTASINSHYTEAIQSLIQKSLSQWSIDQPLDISQEIKIFTIKVISQIILGFQEDDETHYSDIVDAMDILEDVYSQIITSGEDKVKFKKAPQTIERVIEYCLQNSTTLFIEKLRKSENESDQRLRLTRNQSQLMIGVLLFTGYKTTVTALIEIFWQLANQPKLQEKVYLLPDTEQKIQQIDKIIKEGVRHKSAAYIVNRTLRNTTTFECRRQESKEVEFYTLKAGNVITTCPSLVAKNPQLFLNPEKFDPERHQTNEAFNHLFTFGYGTHKCPGQNLFWIEATQLLLAAIQHYQFELIQEKKPESKGLVTDQFITKVFLKIIARNQGKEEEKLNR